LFDEFDNSGFVDVIVGLSQISGSADVEIRMTLVKLNPCLKPATHKFGSGTACFNPTSLNVILGGLSGCVSRWII